MHFDHAITRRPGKDFADGITKSGLGSPDYTLMLKQHEEYIKTLVELGLSVDVLDALPGYPDSYFVEDVAVITPDVAVLTNPGALSRRGEKVFIENALAPYRELLHINPPGTLDGGDVLMIDTHFFIGISERTNMEGVQQLTKIFKSFGNTCTPVSVKAGLHLKSSVNYLGNNSLIISKDLFNYPEFRDYKKISLSPDEVYAGNILWINDVLLMPEGYPKTRRAIGNLGLDIIELDVSEAKKMDGGLTCMSLRF